MNIQRPLFLSILAILMVLSGLTIGCRKYEDGPTISFRSRSERVMNNWQAVLISRNDIEETQRYDYMHLFFRDNNTFEWKFKERDSVNEEIFLSSWELATNDLQIKLTYLDETTGQERLLYFDVLRLKEDELWLDYVRDGDYHSIRLAPL
ncbi:MAG: hypothetical protein AAGI38_13095 [Bacteroidota bacterium]